MQCLQYYRSVLAKAALAEFRWCRSHIKGLVVGECILAIGSLALGYFWQTASTLLALVVGTILFFASAFFVFAVRTPWLLHRQQQEVITHLTELFSPALPVDAETLRWFLKKVQDHVDRFHEYARGVMQSKAMVRSHGANLPPPLRQLELDLMKQFLGLDKSPGDFSLFVPYMKEDLVRTAVSITDACKKELDLLEWSGERSVRLREAIMPANDAWKIAMEELRDRIIQQINHVAKNAKT